MKKKALISIAGCLVLNACTRASNPVSQISIQIPNSVNDKILKLEKPNKLAMSYDQMCFAANVTASDIAPSQASNCDIPIGTFAGPVAPGGTISVSVAQGTNRSLAILGFLKKSAADACPNFTSGFDKFDRTRIFVLGTVPSFDVSAPVVNLTVNLALPDPSLSLQTLNSLPPSCEFLPPPASLAGIGSAAGTVSGNGIIIKGRVRESDNLVKLTGGNFVMKMGKVQ